MGTIDYLLDFLCGNRFEREVADILLSAGDNNKKDPSFWGYVLNRLSEASSCASFRCYSEIARCHILCVAVAPDSSHLWTGKVLEGLEGRLAKGYTNLDAFVMGAQLGLFLAGKWLQEKRQMLLGGNFLFGVACYCKVLFGEECSPVNIENYDAEMGRARHELDQAVKDYLRPQNADLSRRIKIEIHDMLTVLQGAEFKDNPLLCGRAFRPDRWLLDALLHGSLDISSRTRQELIAAALATVT